jgi:N-formylglutamate deformylase
MNIYEFHRGTLPLLISIPHAGIEVPASIAHRFTSGGARLPDTDWHVDKLYAFALELGASVIKANYSRYVVDLNRSSASTALYASDPTSPVCARQTFGGDSIYMSGHEPSAAEIGERIEQYWRPYHERLERELAGMRAQYGRALLWDAHSIASEVSGLFAGVLPEFNLGTRDHASCPREIGNALLEVVTRDGKLGAVLNGRFKGGYITLHYGQPAQGTYAVQLELAQRAYMDETSHLTWEPQRAQSAAGLIAQLLERYLQLATV